MAQQKGVIKLNGTVGDLTFYKSKDGYMVKQKSAVSADRILNDPAFARTRENNTEFGHAGKAGKVLRKAIRQVLLNAKDNRVTSRLTKEMMKVLKADATSTRGQCNVIDGETEMLEGFEFNINAKLGTTLHASYTSTIDRAIGDLTVNIPAFIPAEKISAPQGATHFKIVCAGAEVDFENAVFTSDAKETDNLPLDNVATPVFNLSNLVPVNSTHPLFLLIGIRFMQEVNGVKYSLKNDAFNALAIVKVKGV